MDATGSSLRELFSSARGKQEELEAGTAVYQETLQSAISAYEECGQLIAKLAIFSPNEEVEDISTQDLQYPSTPCSPTPPLTFLQISNNRVHASRTLA
jgi:immunoglobulin-binding protein 1